jgi:hypothetical protein
MNVLSATQPPPPAFSLQVSKHRETSCRAIILRTADFAFVIAVSILIHRSKSRWCCHVDKYL